MRTIIILLITFFSLNISAQKLSVESFTLAQTDISAQTSPRKDLNGVNCALVKVQFVGDIANVEGSVIKPWVRHNNETWVYMTQNSPKMQITASNYLPLMVTFSDYGINRLESNRTYILTISAPSGNAAVKQQLNIKVIPANATVIIDGDLVNDRSISLSVGSHTYNVVANGYYPQSGEVKVTANAPAKLTVELDRKTNSSENTNSQNAITTQPAMSHAEEPFASVNHTNEPQTFTVNGVTFEMIPVQGGTFTMGATIEQVSESEKDEYPTHQVTLNSYYIGKYEVTQALWKAVMSKNPSHWEGDNLPVQRVRWNDCVDFINRLNSVTGKNFRLPTEAEWEYACRGGNKSQGYKYSGSNNIDEVAWYWDTKPRKTHEVGTKKPNELGIYDMSGNVCEWCSDWYGDYSSSAQTNPTGASSGSYRVYRGGSWFINARYCRVSYRGSSTPGGRSDYLGLRLVLSE